MKRFKFKKDKMYFFKWHDASSGTGWRNEREALESKPSIIHNVGFYLGENKTEYIFVGTHDKGADLYNNVMWRPKGMMLEAKEIK